MGVTVQRMVMEETQDIQLALRDTNIELGPQNGIIWSELSQALVKSEDHPVRGLGEAGLTCLLKGHLLLIKAALLAGRRVLSPPSPSPLCDTACCFKSQESQL